LLTLISNTKPPLKNGDSVYYFVFRRLPFNNFFNSSLRFRPGLLIVGNKCRRYLFFVSKTEQQLLYVCKNASPFVETQSLD